MSYSDSNAQWHMDHWTKMSHQRHIVNSQQLDELKEKFNATDIRKNKNEGNSADYRLFFAEENR